MEYQEFINDIQSLEFVGDEKVADALIKAVLGILSSSLREEDAKIMIESLPEPLNVSTLIGHQIRPSPVSFDQCIAEIAQQFDLEEEQARTLTEAVLRSTRAALGGEKLAQVEDVLPASWSAALENA